MAKKCVPNNPIMRDASVEATRIALGIQASYTREFGMPMNELPGFKVILKNLTRDLGLEKLKLKTAIGKKQIRKIFEHGNEVRNLNKNIKNTNKKIAEAPDKFKRVSRIRDMLIDNINWWADQNLYDINPDIYFPIIKEFLLERYGTLPSMKTTIGGLNQMEVRLKKIFNQQKLRDKKPLTAFKRQMQDPGILILKQDPTGLAYDLVNKSRQAPAEIFGTVNKYNNRVKEVTSTFKGWIKSNNFLFRVNVPSHGQVDHRTKAKSFDNMIKFAFDTMDGRSKYIVPKDLGSAEFKADELGKTGYNAIVKRNLLRKINEGGEIQKHSSGFYYVAIKQDIERHDGKEVYYAYQVPHKPGKEKEGVETRDFLLLPRTNEEGIKGDLSRKEYDQALGQNVRLAAYTNEAGQTIEGRMAEGWYEAKQYLPLESRREEVYGSQKVIRKETLHSYSNYMYNDNLNTTDHPASQRDLPPVFWRFIKDLRATLKEFHTYATDKNRTTEQVRKGIVSSLTKLGTKRLSKDEFDSLLKQALNIDGLRSNMRIDDKGNLITANTFFGELYNYIPWRYTVNDLIKGNVDAREALHAKIAELKRAIEYEAYKSGEGLTPAEVLDKSAELASRKLDLEILTGTKDKEGNVITPGLVSHFDDLIDSAAGLKTLHNSERLNQVQTIAAAQHRKGFLNPFPTYDKEGNVINHGRLADMEIFGDYFYETARTLVHNDLRNDLLNVLGNTTSSVSEFMIDHIKATFGMLDVNAGIFGFDYSNPKISKKIEKAMKNFMGPDFTVTPENLHTVARMHSMFISGNLLQLGSTLNNNFQRLSVWIEAVNQDWEEVDRLMGTKNEESGNFYADEIAEASGVTEVSIGLADSLMGMMSDDVTFGSGWFAKQDYLVLTLGKQEALKKMRNTKVWIKFFNGVIKRRQGGVKATTTQLNNMYEGTWEMINGIKEGVLTKEQLKGIRKNFEGVIQAELVNEYASWGLKGGYASGILKKWRGGEYFTFSGSEENMRKWTAVHGVVLAKQLGLIPQEVIDDPGKFGYSSMYMHPNALKMARILNNITMFGLSPQFLPPMFRGAVGTLFFKFKPYQWHQGRREMYTILNFWDSLSGLKKREQLTHVLSTLMPPALGITRKEMLGLNIPVPTFTKSKEILSEPSEKLKRFLWSRVLISVIFTPLIFLPGITSVQKFVRNQSRGTTYGFGQRAMERGGESVIASSAIQLFQVLALIGGYIDDDEEREDDVMRDARRWFLPFYVNLAMEAFNGRPGSVVRAYSQSVYKVGKKLMEWTGIGDGD